MRITVNGQERVLDSSRNLAEFIEQMGLVNTPLIAEVNGEIVKDDQWPLKDIHEGDVIELLRFVGGG